MAMADKNESQPASDLPVEDVREPDISPADTPGSDLPTALRRALPLMTDPPDEPTMVRGYLDLLGGTRPEPSGFIQSVWVSGPGARLYDGGQAAMRRLMTVGRPLGSWLRLPTGGTALDVGSGPGNITGAMGRLVGPDGLALGVDISVPMLERATRAEATENVGFLRADATDLPFRDNTFDGVSALAVLQLIPDPHQLLTEIVRVLKPSGRLAILVPTSASGIPTPITNLVGSLAGLKFFGADEIGERLLGLGMAAVHTRIHGPMLVISARR